MIIAENGFKELYRGLVPVLLRNGPSNAVFFILREEAQKLPQGVRLLDIFDIEFKLISSLESARTLQSIEIFINSSPVP